MERILRIDMTTGSISVSPLPEEYRTLGGRSLTSRIVCDEVDPTCDPLGPRNKLVFSPGLLSGTVLSSSSRISVGCKSPLTGGIKEANSGGQSGLKMAMLGYRGLIVEGQPAEGWWILIVDKDGGRLERADEHADLLTPELASRLFDRFGKKVGLSLIGPTGQRLMNLAGICNTDPELRPSRLNARGGVGAVMGSKGLLAIIWNEPGYQAVKALDDALWKSAGRAYLTELRSQPATAERFPKFGTAGTLEVVNRLGGLPIRNFSRGQDAATESITGLRMREVILERGGLTTHSCMTGCAIQCSNVYVDKDGNEMASSMEFETNGLMGANLEIFDLDEIARFTKWCNDLGIDTIETGGALGVAMEAGMIPWGDSGAVLKALEEIRTGSPLGRLLGLGAGLCGKALGVRRVPVVRNQTISAYDPRAIKGNGVTYCTSAMGADHTAGNTIALQVDHLDPKGKVEASRSIQITATLLDVFGFCNFARGVYNAKADAFADLYEARLGEKTTPEAMAKYAADVNRWEIDFNVRAGLPKVEPLQEWMRDEPLAPHQAHFDISVEEMERIWDED